MVKHETAPTIIIGGGIAGLMCARALTVAGRNVLLLEREAEVGGRVRTSMRDGFRLDHGFQVLFTAYPTLCAALDLPALHLRAFRPAARIAGTGHNPALIGDALADTSLLLPTLRAPQLSLADKLRLLRLRYSATSMSFDDCFRSQFDCMSTREYLQTQGFSARAIESFFAPFYGGILLDRTLSTSAAVLLYTFRMLARGQTVVPANGIGAIAQQLAAQVPALSIRTGAEVTRIDRSAGAITGVTLRSGETIASSDVVLACDAPHLASLAATAGVHVAVPDGQLGCSTVYLRSTSVLLPGDALWLHAAPDATVSHAITISNVAPSYAPAGQTLTAATVLGVAAELPDEPLVHRVRSDLGTMGGQHQAASNAELLAVWRVPYSQYAQPPGSAERRVSAVTSQSGLFIASELGHTSSLEGAARGGVAAAEAVLHGGASR
jgi:phytoene dehydrogenase-like protein